MSPQKGIEPVTYKEFEAILGAFLKTRIKLSREINLISQLCDASSAAGFVETQRGRGGGLRLARPPSQINVGDVVRKLENTTGFVACMGGKEDCVIDGACGLKPALSGALNAFLAHLDQFDLAQITGSRSRFLQQLATEKA